MKSDTPVLILKGTCHALVGACTPLGSSLAQWLNSGEWPPKIAWFVIIGAMVGGAANSIISFLSSAWSDYQDARSDTKIVEKAVNVTESPTAPQEVPPAPLKAKESPKL